MNAFTTSARELVRTLELFELRLAELEKAAGDLKSPSVNQQRWMSAKEVATYLSVSLTTVHNWTKEGRLVKHKYGGAARFDRQDIDRRIGFLSPYKKPYHG